METDYCIHALIVRKMHGEVYFISSLRFGGLSIKFIKRICYSAM